MLNPEKLSDSVLLSTLEYIRLQLTSRGAFKFKYVINPRKTRYVYNLNGPNYYYREGDITDYYLAVVHNNRANNAIEKYYAYFDVLRKEAIKRQWAKITPEMRLKTSQENARHMIDRVNEFEGFLGQNIAHNKKEINANTRQLKNMVAMRDKYARL